MPSQLPSFPFGSSKDATVCGFSIIHLLFSSAAVDSFYHPLLRASVELLSSPGSLVTYNKVLNQNKASQLLLPPVKMYVSSRPINCVSAYLSLCHVCMALMMMMILPSWLASCFKGKAIDTTIILPSVMVWSLEHDEPACVRDSRQKRVSWREVRVNKKRRRRREREIVLNEWEFSYSL